MRNQYQSEKCSGFIKGLSPEYKPKNNELLPPPLDITTMILYFFLGFKIHLFHSLNFPYDTNIKGGFFSLQNPKESQVPPLIHISYSKYHMTCPNFLVALISVQNPIVKNKRVQRIRGSIYQLKRQCSSNEHIIQVYC